MFAQTNNQLLPLIVVDTEGKRVRAKLVELVIDRTSKTAAIIIQAKVKTHPK